MKSVSDFSINRQARDGLFAWCKGCARAYAKSWGDTNPERKKENYTRWAAANPERRAELRREKTLRDRAGMTRDDYDRMLAAQNGGCAICTSPPKGKRVLHVDHCHSTDVVRGLLCGNCNTALGLMKDDVPRLRAAIRYLQEKR